MTPCSSALFSGMSCMTDRSTSGTAYMHHEVRGGSREPGRVDQWTVDHGPRQTSLAWGSTWFTNGTVGSGTRWSEVKLYNTDRLHLVELCATMGFAMIVLFYECDSRLG